MAKYALFCSAIYIVLGAKTPLLGKDLDPTSSIPTPWEEVYTKDSIAVFQKPVPDDPLLVFKIHAELNASIESIMANLRDVEGSPEWQPGLEAKSTLVEMSDLAAITYSESEVPWPFANRDFVLHNELRLDSASQFLIVDIYSVTHPDSPPKKGLVRGEIRTGMFCVRPLAAEKTLVIFYLQLDPKGNIPKWIVNYVQRKWTYTFMKTIEKRAKEHPMPLRPGLAKQLNQLKKLIASEKPANVPHL